MKKERNSSAFTQRQLRVGELVKQNLGEILSGMKQKYPQLTQKLSQLPRSE